MIVRRTLLPCALLALGFPSLLQAQKSPIQITADLSDATRKIYHAEVDIPVQPGPVSLTTPKWIPGNHRPTGPDTHPLYKSLIAAKPKAIGPTRESFRENLNNFLKNKHNGATTNPEPGILWNFEKFLIDRNGRIAARFSPEVLPDDPAVIAAIESALNS